MDSTTLAAQMKAQRTLKAYDMILHGELYLDTTGEPHFICHTPGNMSFAEVREGLVKFIALLQNQHDRQEECPHYTPHE